MIEQYVYNLITGDSTLQSLLSNGAGGYHLYPGVIPRGVTGFDQAVAFSVITTNDAYPNIESQVVQFNVFAKSHTTAANIAAALKALFNQDTRQTSGGIEVVYSERQSETDLGKDYDTDLYQRACSYYFKIR